MLGLSGHMWNLNLAVAVCVGAGVGVRERKCNRQLYAQHFVVDLMSKI